MAPTRIGLALALPLATAASLAACTAEEIDDFLGGGSLTTVSVYLYNDDSDFIHILAEGESFGPGNRLTPGGGRAVRLGVIEDQAVEFRAGRNGAVIATAQCVPRGDFTHIDPNVIWSGQGLACANWDNR